MEKENMPVIDFSEFPEPYSDAFVWMPETEFEQYEIYCEYIQLGTSVPNGTKIESGFYCRNEMPDGELCDGTIYVTQLDEPAQIRWSCRICTEKGAIINYEGTEWDNSHLSENEKEMFLESFFTDIEGDDLFEDEFFDLFEDSSQGPFANFEYYLNPYDPEGVQTGGPSSAVIEELLKCDWTDPDSPIYLNKNLPLKELEKSYFFYSARQFLLTLKEDEAFKLTRTNSMKRSVVRRLIGQTRWPENYIENLSKYKENLDEMDVWLLHGVRVLLELAGLIEQDEDRLHFNEDYLHLLDEANAGQLYRLLFSTYFKQMNLGYLGSTFELPNLQYSIPFILYKLDILARKWISIEELLPDILLSSVNLELDFEFHETTELSRDLLFEDLFSSLNRFALLQTRKSSDVKSGDYPDQVRITPLMEKFLVFKI